MAVKLWTVHFMRICVANLLLFISLYVLFPVLSVEMADRLGVPAAQTGVIFLFFTLGMFLIGPFHAYLVDAYKRKYVCMFAAALMVVATIGYAFVTNFTELILLSTVQGLAFGIGTTAGITGYRHHQLHTAERGKCQLLVDGTSGNAFGDYPRSVALSKPLIPKPAHCICHNRSCRNSHAIGGICTFPCADCH